MPHIWAVSEFRREFQKDSSLGPRTMFFVHLPYHFIFQCVLNYSFKFKWSSPTARILQVKHPFSLKSDCLEINKKNELKLNFRLCLKEDKKIKPASTNSIFAFNGWDQNTFLENKSQKWYSISFIYEVLYLPEASALKWPVSSYVAAEFLCGFLPSSTLVIILLADIPGVSGSCLLAWGLGHVSVT